MVKTKDSVKKLKVTESFDNEEEIESEVDEARSDGKNDENGKRYMCIICDKKFKLRHHYNNHARVHTGERPFNCKICQYKCKQSQQLRTHMRTHTGEKPYKCKFCDYESSQKGSLTNHMKTHTGVKPFKCMFCNYESARKQHLQIHLKIHLGEKPFECHLCEYRTTRKEVLTTHLKTHVGKTPYSCEFCNLNFYIYSKLRRHLEIHSEERKLKYGQKKVGIKVEKSSNRLKKSEESLDSNVYEETMFNCIDLKYRNNSILPEDNETNESFDSQVPRLENYRRYVRNTTNEESDEEVFACKLCEEEFRDEEKMREHFKTHISDVLNLKTREVYESTVYNCLSDQRNENMYSCDICRKKFADPQSLRKHLTIHTSQSDSSCRHDDTELLNCDLCDLTFYEKCELNNHLDKDHRHNETDEFKYFKNQVLRKSKIHSVSSEQHLENVSVIDKNSEAVFACKICEQEFSNVEDLPNHLKVHERENHLRNNLLYLRKDTSDSKDLNNQKEIKLYSCTICNKKFLHKSHCRDHVKAHLNDKLYECYLCDFKSSQKENLASHVKIHLQEKAYECPNCSYKCQHKKQLDNHLIAHWMENSSKFSSEGNPFVCKVCDKEFTCEQQFYDHNRIHNREKSSKLGKHNSTFNMV